MKFFVTLIASVTFFVIGAIDANAETATADNISNYLVDISAGQVSAGGLVGLTGSAITDIQSTQDLILAINPFSSGSSKSGYGLAITPARTNIMPIKGSDYMSNDWMRLWGATTISYAENSATISGSAYQKSAASIDTTFYWQKMDDPIIKAADLFAEGPGSCLERKVKDDEISTFYATHTVEQLKEDGNKLAVEKIRVAAVEAWAKCLKSEANKAKWNATKLSLSFGAGWIKPDAAAGTKQSLGRTLALGGIIELGSDSAAYITMHRTTGEVDLNTLAGTPTFSNSSIAAIRFTQGSTNNGDLRWLIEFSNANASSVTMSNDVFKYAVGIDKKLFPGAWLEFRVGRNRTLDSTTTQTTSLLNLKWVPSSNLFSSK